MSLFRGLSVSLIQGELSGVFDLCRCMDLAQVTTDPDLVGVSLQSV